MCVCVCDFDFDFDIDALFCLVCAFFAALPATVSSRLRACRQIDPHSDEASRFFVVVAQSERWEFDFEFHLFSIRDKLLGNQLVFVIFIIRMTIAKLFLSIRASS